MKKVTKKYKSQTVTDYVLLFTPAVVVLIMAPFPSIDRFNGPKIVVLSALLLVASLSAWRSVGNAAMPIDLPQFVLFLFLIASIVTSMISSQDIPSQLFGRLGRNSGLLAYLLFAILFLLVKLIKRDNRLEIFCFQ